MRLVLLPNRCFIPWASKEIQNADRNHEKPCEDREESVYQQRSSVMFITYQEGIVSLHSFESRASVHFVQDRLEWNQYPQRTFDQE